MKFPGFIGPGYQGRSRAVNSQRCVNLYLEIDQANGKTPLALYGMPGLTTLVTPTTGPVRGAREVQGRCFFVVGSGLYEISSSMSATLRGTIGTSSGFVDMEDCGTQLMLVDGQYGYTLTLASNTFAQITDPDFPNGTKSVTFQDGYFIIVEYGTQKFYVSATNDATSWDALDFASAEGIPDDLVAAFSIQRNLYLLGESSIEAWSNTGAADFPFERIQGSFIETGCAAFASATKLDNSLFFIGNDQRGALAIYRIEQFQPVRISTHAIEYQLSTYSTVSDAIGFAFNLFGHAFYVLTFPTADVTWVYDCATKAWIEWAYFSVGAFHRHRANCFAYCFGKLMIGDHTNGKIYELDPDVYTDAGDPIVALRSAPILSNNEKYVFHSELQVVMEHGVGLTSGQGSDPEIMLRTSKDGGNTWGTIKTAKIGKVGRYADRSVFRRLGMAENMVYEVSISDPVKRVFVDAQIELS